MTKPKHTWFRRHHGAVFVVITWLVVFGGGGYALVSYVLRVRTAANRAADL